MESPGTLSGISAFFLRFLVAQVVLPVQIERGGIAPLAVTLVEVIVLSPRRFGGDWMGLEKPNELLVGADNLVAVPTFLRRIALRHGSPSLSLL